MKIKEIIIVEGKHDTQKLKSCVECDTIETSGVHLTKAKLELIRMLQKQRGVIIFTDPDVPGEKIRQLINQQVPGCKNAFIEKRKARTTHKVGVEHASPQDIIESLQHLMTYEEQQTPTLTWLEFLQLGLNGQANSSYDRELLGNALFIGKCNAKTLWKRMNMLGLNKHDIEKLIDDLDIKKKETKEEKHETKHCDTV